MLRLRAADDVADLLIDQREISQKISPRQSTRFNQSA
jgi:hypothetical protein